MNLNGNVVGVEYRLACEGWLRVVDGLDGNVGEMVRGYDGMNVLGDSVKILR